MRGRGKERVGERKKMRGRITSLMIIRPLPHPNEVSEYSDSGLIIKKPFSCYKHLSSCFNGHALNRLPIIVSISLCSRNKLKAILKRMSFLESFFRERCILLKVFLLIF